MSNNLLAKSKNCSIELEAWKREKENGKIGLAVGGFVSIAIAVFLIFGSDSDKEKSILGLVFMFLALGMLYFLDKIHKNLKRDGDYFLNLCKTEYLMVYEDKICGECAKGDFVLSINQVESVTHFSEGNVNNEHFKNDELIIYDIVGNSYSFKTFSNARELEMIIQNLIVKEVDKNEKMS